MRFQSEDNYDCFFGEFPVEPALGSRNCGAADYRWLDRHQPERQGKTHFLRLLVVPLSPCGWDSLGAIARKGRRFR